MSEATPVAEREQAEIHSAIEEIFGSRAAVAIRYAELLTTVGIDHGLLGPREADRVWQRHILNSVVLAPLIPAGARVVDLGSGAGLPGIPIAIARPDLNVVLLEPMQRRVRFLQSCVDDLPLPGVQVQQGRAEAGLSPLADVVVARAIAPLDVLMRLSFEVLVDGGVVLALKGATAVGELEVVKQDSTIEAELLTLPAPGQPATVVRIVRPPRPAASGGSRRSRRSGRGSR